MFEGKPQGQAGVSEDAGNVLQAREEAVVTSQLLVPKASVLTRLPCTLSSAVHLGNLSLLLTLWDTSQSL